jgi:hypothetical protein
MVGSTYNPLPRRTPRIIVIRATPANVLKNSGISGEKSEAGRGNQR